MRVLMPKFSRSGFTLVEVSLAVLVVGLGLLTLFSLFPSGLRSGEDALADTRAALFASVVLEGMRANASTVSNWAEWINSGPMKSRLCNAIDGVGSLTADGNMRTIADFPLGSMRPLRYALTINYLGDPPPTAVRGYSAYLKVWERTGPTNSFNQFYTEFTYGGR